MSMLKGLKGKKDSKGDGKKDKKDKQTKKQKKVVKEEEEDNADPLVDMSQFDTTKQESKTTKKINKIQSSKLQQKQIDTSNIVVEKKEEKKQIKSWVVNESDISKTFSQKFDMNKVDTEFQSLTDQKLNKQLEEKAKRQAEQNKHKVVEEKGGIKYATLEKSNTNYVDANEMSFNKKPAQNAFNIGPGIQIASTPTPLNFTNSNTAVNFVPLEKTKQQLKEEEMEKKAGQIVTKKDTWLGKKTETKPVVVEQPKLSGWAAKAAQEGDIAPMKFAPLQKSQTRSGRQEQEFVFTSKKQAEERRKKREQQNAKATKA